jgi:magnesium transporter
MLTLFVHRAGRTEIAETVDPAWLDPASDTLVWADLDKPTSAEAAVLGERFPLHELALEDALATIHHPKVESYGSFPDGLPNLMHAIVDRMVDNYEPEIEKLSKRLDQVEDEAVKGYGRQVMRRILDVKKDVASLRRVTLPQRDVVARLARREFPEFSEAVAYRFRDVFDHLVRVADETLIFQDRITSLLDAHLASVSNRLNEVMKVLTIVGTIFMPLTVLTGLYGMNVPLPHLPGGAPAQFWWVLAMMAAISGVMLWFFRRRGWF